MRLIITFLPALLLAGATVSAAPDPPAPPPEKQGKAPVVLNIRLLSDCPAPVQAGVKRDGHEAKITGIRRIDADGIVLWAFETGSEDDGQDAEVNYFYKEDGALHRIESDLPLKDAPEAVRRKLKELAGDKAVVDDVEEVKEGGKISYKAELESNGDTDRKVRLTAEGEVLSLTEETDD